MTALRPWTPRPRRPCGTGLHQVMPDLTCFIITHRPATLELTDRIIVLDNGQIVEAGTHEELLQQEGLYFKLYSRIRLEEDVGAKDGQAGSKTESGGQDLNGAGGTAINP